MYLPNYNCSSENVRNRIENKLTVIECNRLQTKRLIDWIVDWNSNECIECRCGDGQHLQRDSKECVIEENRIGDNRIEDRLNSGR